MHILDTKEVGIMTKIDIYSGFLGAGKTTLIKKLISEHYKGQKIVLIENEFGEIGIDSGFLTDAGINITEMNSACICCSLVGDFGKALEKVIVDYAPERILIEPSGVGKLSDVIAAVDKVTNDDVSLGYTVAVVDATKVKVYMKNFGEFYNNQVETASTIILSRTADISQEKLSKAMELIRQINADATIITTNWDDLTAEQIIEAFDGNASVAKDLAALQNEHHHEHHHHDDEEHHCCEHHHGEHHHDEEHHCCGHHHGEHHQDEEHHCCGHHHGEHHHDEEHYCCGHHGEHHHHSHEHGEHCCCGHHHGEHHHDHHADEVFASWGVETTRKFTLKEIESALMSLDTGRFGVILRAKGIVAAEDGKWIHFDYVPGELNVRTGAASIIGKICVIGAQLDEVGLSKVFDV